VARIPDDVLDQIRRAVDLPELVGRYVPLKRSGRSFSACCPFHQEKTPSFHVHPESGIWKCYGGCGKAGNAFTFLMEKEGLRFFEAVKQLAREHGVALPDDDDPEASARAARADRLREVAEWACHRFEAALRAPEGERARAYFKRRGITGETAWDFRLGYAPPGWDHLLVAARREGMPEADLLEAGLVIPREGRDGTYDRFRDRVMFPIHDPQGRVIAFGGRVLGDEEPKYLNSPETPVFTKGRHLYAFHVAKAEMLRTGEGAVMEGYTDVILAHQAGFKVAVAGLGTALTPEQARKLAPYVKRLFLVYDGDAAGLKAAERAIPAFLPEPIETRVCVLPGEKDPADVFFEDGAEAFRACLAQSREAFDHLLAARAAANDVSTVPGKTAAILEALGALVGVKDEMRRALYVKRLADEYGVPEDVAARRLQELRARARPSDRGDEPPRRGPVSTATSSTPPSAAPRAEAARATPSPDATGAPGEPPEEPPTEPPTGPPPVVERQLLEALVGAPALLADAPAWLPDALTHRPCRRLLVLLLEARARGGGVPDVARLLGTLAEPPLAALGAELLASGEGKRLLEQGRDCLRRLQAHHEERSLQEGLRGTDSDAEEADLLRRLQEHHRRRAAR
jgi:DNA primase